MADYSAVRGGTAYDEDGSKIGSIDEIYTDKDTGEPSFATVHTGLFGTKTTFVPLTGATVEGNDLRVPYTKAHIKDAPNVDADQDITDEEQDRLYRHYGTSTGFAGAGTRTDRDATGGVDGDRSATGTATGTGVAGGVDRDRDDLTSGDARGTVGHDTSGPTTDDAMTRSEEHLEVGTQTREAGRARLRKYVTSETQTADVQVAHEELRVEREPITDANRGSAHDGPGISEEEHEVVLHEERPVVAKETVPVERVRLDKDTVTDTETVTDDVRKEQIELDEPERATAGTSRTDAGRTETGRTGTGRTDR